MKQKDYIIGEKFEMYSEILKEKREIFIYLPETSIEKQKIPVIYLMDGEINFHLFTGIINYYVQSHQFIPVVIVAIPNKDRENDFDPETDKIDLFINFMEKELFILIERKYNASKKRILYGHSYLGVFTLHCFINYPDLFEVYISSSPSIKWSKKINSGEFNFQNLIKKTKYLLIGVGENDIDHIKQNIVRLVDKMKELPSLVTFSYQLYDKADHNTVAFISFCSGLELIKKWHLKCKEK